MWNGQIIPIIDDYIPIPLGIGRRLGFIPGTRLIASAYEMEDEASNPSEGERPDLVGGILFSLTRKRAIDRTTRFTFLLKNKVGSIHYISSIISESNGQIIRMEALGSGHVTCQIVFPKSEDLLTAANRLAPSNNDSPVIDLTIGPPLIASQDGDRNLINELERLQKTVGLSIHSPAGWMRKVLTSAYKLEERAARFAPSTYVAVSTVRVTDDGIPFPEDIYKFLANRSKYKKKPRAAPHSVQRPTHVVIATAPDELGLTCLIPSRPLVEVSVRSTTLSPRDPAPGRQVIERITDVLKSARVNIVHMQIENSACKYEHSVENPGSLGSKKRKEYLSRLNSEYDAIGLSPSYEDGLIRFIVSVPAHWQGLGVEQMESELDTLKQQIRGIQLDGPSGHTAIDTLQRLLNLTDGLLQSGLLKTWESAVWPSLMKSGEPSLKVRMESLRDSLVDFMKELNSTSSRHGGTGKSPDEMRNLGRKVLVTYMKASTSLQLLSTLAKQENPEPVISNLPELRLLRAQFAGFGLKKVIDSGLPSVSMPLREVDIHGPPLLRCFFAHSDQPDTEERQLISQVRQMLEGLSLHVVEGKWTYGRPIDDSTRAQIKKAAVLVSLLWPRTRRTDELSQRQELLASEWIIHEESFAMGLNASIFRFREGTVREPQYRRDFREYVIKSDDTRTWDDALIECRAQMKKYIVSQMLVHEDQ